MTATVIPTITPAQFAQRLAALFPNGWASQDAKSGGVLYALLLALGTQLNAVLGQVQYADSAVYVGSETAPELDLAGLDFYGGSRPRPPGANDAAYAALILSGLFQPAATRIAIFNAIQRLTGYPPRMIEPWNPNDTGAWDTNGVSFWDVDNAQSPFLWTGEEAATAFIKTAPPVSTSNPNANQLFAWDAGAYWDVQTSAFYDTVFNPIVSIYQLINNIRAIGVSVGVRIVSPLELYEGLLPYNPNLVFSPSGVGFYGQSLYGGAVYG
jgi:hypothetical protein